MEFSLAFILEKWLTLTITNNLDLETKEHVVQVLKAYPGAMIVISHETDFLEEIGIDEVVNVGKFK